MAYSKYLLQRGHNEDDIDRDSEGDVDHHSEGDIDHGSEGDVDRESDGDGDGQTAKRGINQRCCLTLLLYSVDLGPCYIFTTIMQM